MEMKNFFWERESYDTFSDFDQREGLFCEYFCSLVFLFFPVEPGSLAAVSGILRSIHGKLFVLHEGHSHRNSISLTS